MNGSDLRNSLRVFSRGSGRIVVFVFLYDAQKAGGIK